MKITKHIFSGDGFANNIGYKVVDNVSGYDVAISFSKREGG